mgnify:CR=1 FL=1
MYDHSEKIKSVLVRVNGIGTEKIIDRDKEMKIILEFSKLGKGPIVYCTFNNGFMYQYFEGRALQPDGLFFSKDFLHQIFVMKKLVIKLLVIWQVCINAILCVWKENLSYSKL